MRKLLPLILLISTHSIVGQISGRVVGVSDGDTITVLIQRNRQIKVRLAGIDAPEKGQDYSDTAKRMLSSLVFLQSVTVEGNKIDRYGRLVGKVLVINKDVNLALVQLGLAWHFKKYDSEQTVQDRKAYALAEVEARTARLNLWSYPNPIAPWDYREGIVPTGGVIPSNERGQVIGNKNSKIYHVPGCQSYSKVSEKNRVYFRNEREALSAGFRKAKNC